METSITFKVFCHKGTSQIAGYYIGYHVVGVYLISLLNSTHKLQTIPVEDFVDKYDLSNQYVEMDRILMVLYPTA